MSEARSEPVEVLLDEGRPARFIWRGRLYTVLSVIERPDQPAPEGPPAARWRCWRVMASPGKNVPAGAYRLCHDAAAGRWRLTRDSG